MLLWQNARRIVNADWRGWKSVALWAESVSDFQFALWLDRLNWPGAVLFGVIAASMIWRAGEPEDGASYMSQIGPLTLFFLLTEVEVAIQSPDHYVGGIFSGAFFGVVTALFGLYLLRKISPKFHALIGIGQVYLAYWFSYIAGVSAVTAALISVMTFVWLNQYYKLGFHEKRPPAPLNTWPGFVFILALFLLLGWQAHQPASILFVIEVAVGVLLGLGITWLGRRWEIPAFHEERPFWMAGADSLIAISRTITLAAKYLASTHPTLSSHWNFRFSDLFFSFGTVVLFPEKEYFIRKIIYDTIFTVRNRPRNHYRRR